MILHDPRPATRHGLPTIRAIPPLPNRLRIDAGGTTESYCVTPGFRRWMCDMDVRPSETLLWLGPNLTLNGGGTIVQERISFPSLDRFTGRLERYPDERRTTSGTDTFIIFFFPHLLRKLLVTTKPGQELRGSHPHNEGSRDVPLT